MKLEDASEIEKIIENVALITIIDSKGSVPRNKNASMVVTAHKEFGTIGGGELEFQIIKSAKILIKDNKNNEKIMELPLGPNLGQCCGGYVKVKITKFNNGKLLIKNYDIRNEILKKNKNLYIFGAGHVAKSIISKLEGVGFNIFVVDSRQSFVSSIDYKYVISILAKDNETIINSAPPQSFFLIMTHSHQIDLDICSLLLTKKNFSFIGLIGSKTKKIRFSKKLFNLGHSQNQINQIECPIGINTIHGKEPDVIAISIIARLLEYKSSLSNYNQQIVKLMKV